MKIRRPDARATREALADLPRLLTVADLASWLGTSRKAVYAKIERGQLRDCVLRVGRRLYFRSDLLLRSLSQQGRVP
jgi:helix-turn-helix protein